MAMFSLYGRRARGIRAVALSRQAIGRTQRLSGGTIIGDAPSVALDDQGNSIASWAERRGLVVARASQGRWGTPVRFTGWDEQVAVAAVDGAAAVLYTVPSGVALAVAAPGAALGPARMLAADDGNCCALILRPGGALTAAWADTADQAHVHVVDVAADGGLRAALTSTSQGEGVIDYPPVAGSGPDGTDVIAWSETPDLLHVATRPVGGQFSVDHLADFSFEQPAAPRVGALGTVFVAGSTNLVAALAIRPPAAPLRRLVRRRGTPRGAATLPTGPLLLYTDLAGRLLAYGP
jgi:hypothetical protein